MAWICATTRKKRRSAAGILFMSSAKNVALWPSERMTSSEISPTRCGISTTLTRAPLALAGTPRGGTDAAAGAPTSSCRHSEVLFDRWRRVVEMHGTFRLAPDELADFGLVRGAQFL